MLQPFPIPRDKLLAYCKKAFEGYHLAPTTVQIYICVMRNVASYMESQGIEFYDFEFSDSYLDLIVKTDATRSRQRGQTYFSVLSLLNRTIKGLPYSQYRRPRKEGPGFPNNELGKFGKDFMENDVSKRHLNPSTILRYNYCTQEFTQAMALQGVDNPMELTREKVLAYVTSRTTSSHHWYTHIRGFLTYISKSVPIPQSVKTALDGTRKPIISHLTSYYTEDEICKIEKTFDRATKTGKRNYAMTLMASRLGLRVSDVCLLQFKNLDWENNLIKIVQYKTEKELVLPLLADIGNAIIDYLQHARPSSSSQMVFLTQTAPYRPVSGSTFTSFIERAFTKAGISTIGRHTGPHSLRHSLATAMMLKGTEIQVISDTLGHSSTETTMEYLTINVDGLMECANVVPPVDPSFYNQKGGAFYV